MIDPVKLSAAADAAIVAENTTGAPAQLLIAQWALESGWGAHSPGNNCFGIKQYHGCYGRQILHTVEWFNQQELDKFLDGAGGRTATKIIDGGSAGKSKYSVEDWFATFPTLAACFAKRAELFFQGPYKPFADAYATDKDLPKLINGIGPIYADGPGYAAIILKIIRQQNVQLALAEARGGPPEVMA